MSWQRRTGQVLLAIALLLGVLELSRFLVPRLPLLLPVPLLALFLLLILFLLLRKVPAGIRLISTVLLRHLSLFFIPAVIGVGLYLARISPFLTAIGLSMLVSTALSLVITAVIAQRLERPGEHHAE